ncbi:unnamed protein product, partial [Lymnaea stagnalis]
ENSVWALFSFYRYDNMRQFIVFVCLLNVAVGHVKIDNHDVGDSVTRGRDRFGGGVLISRDVIAQNPVDSRSIIDEINKLLVKAPHGISADEMRAFSKKLKHLLHAWIERKKLEVLDEEVTKFIKEITSSFSSVAALDLLNSDALGDEAYRVTVILQMLKRCKEEIQNALGPLCFIQYYDVGIFRVLGTVTCLPTHSEDLIIYINSSKNNDFKNLKKMVRNILTRKNATASSPKVIFNFTVDLYKVNLYKRDVYKRVSKKHFKI